MGYYEAITTCRDKSLMTQEIYDNNKKDVKKRRLFLIRKYEDPKFGKGIYETDSNVVFSCFLSSNTQKGLEIYSGNTSVDIVNGE